MLYVKVFYRNLSHLMCGPVLYKNFCRLYCVINSFTEPSTTQQLLWCNNPTIQYLLLLLCIFYDKFSVSMMYFDKALLIKNYPEALLNLIQFMLKAHFIPSPYLYEFIINISFQMADYASSLKACNVKSSLLLLVYMLWRLM